MKKIIFSLFLFVILLISCDTPKLNEDYVQKHLELILQQNRILYQQNKLIEQQNVYLKQISETLAIIAEKK